MMIVQFIFHYLALALVGLRIAKWERRRRRLLILAAVMLVVLVSYAGCKAEEVSGGVAPGSIDGGHLPTLRATKSERAPTPTARDYGYKLFLLDGRERVANKIVTESLKANVNVSVALRIAECESGFDPLAKNKTSSAAGVYQFKVGTWEYIKAEGDRYNEDRNIAEFLKWFPVHPEWWECK